ncbi:MAG: YraN family protein [Geminocystis sp. GBBB08]|nr:YraN family protein [Geminocystis sp. GBBB08]
MKNFGQWGYKIDAQWVINKGYDILYTRWRCRWGEIDLIAKDNNSQVLAFIEVKTRKIHNWDNDGIFAINQTKQEKLLLTAETFLSENTCFSTFNCRFDIALLIYRKNLAINSEENLRINGNNINYQGYQFQIIDYIENAFN